MNSDDYTTSKLSKKLFWLRFTIERERETGWDIYVRGVDSIPLLQLVR